MKPAYFIVGTDTGAGKTLVTTALLHGFAARGERVAGLKPVAAGCEEFEGQRRCDDSERLRQAGNVILAPAIRTPYALSEAIAPHLAAERESRTIEAAVITAAVDEARRRCDRVLIEGVGGFRVPLSPSFDTADLAVQLGLPLILVVGMRLGCINQTLLTLEAITARRLILAGWVASQPRPAMRAFEDNLASLRARLDAPLLGCLRYRRRIDPAAAAAGLRLDLLR